MCSMKRALRLFCMAATGLVCAFAQKTTTPSAPTTGTTTGTTSGTGGSTSPTSIVPAPSPSVVNSAPRLIYLSGKVVLDDGSPLPGSVNIQSVCGTRQRTVAHTSSAGDFGFEWQDNTAGIFEDASEAGRPSGTNLTTPGSSGTGTSASPGSHLVDPLANCDLRAELAGYTSSRVSLYDHSAFDSFDAGAIVLHRLTGDEGRTVSTLSLKAPKDAKKYFDKGIELARANKTSDAAVSLRKAVASYPQYADAWLSLGQVERQLGARDEARTDFQKAMDLDDKLVGPWEELGFLASDAAKWDEAARYLNQAVLLDPMDSPMAWDFGAVANYNLGKYEMAERDVRAEMKLDHGKNPRAEYLLGLILIARKDLAGGADALRTFIAAAPNAPDAETAKKQLSRVETQLGH
jgi:tetratricopeptide (TPR) repeat protein